MPSAKSFLPSLLLLLLLPFFLHSTIAQTPAGPEAFHIYNGTHRLPAGCLPGYTAARDVVLYNVPYTYTQVLSIIGSFANITWNGVNATTLNGTDNTPGTARFYTSYGIPLVETIKTYSAPAEGPYFEDHTLAPAYNPEADVSIYAAVDSTTVTPICGGAASALDFTIEYCSTNVTAAGPILHGSHVFDATTLQEFLGNETWTGCQNGNGTANTSLPGTPTGTGVSSPVGSGGPVGTGVSDSTGGGNGTIVGGGAGAGPTASLVAFTAGASAAMVSFGAIAAGVVALIL
ncbi:MAG: hypothetical protein L6R39_000865 [Caloplaca ligustica]|nr:MAG: hypothetical protein L6R39_000865 [Caloplaca ligustica]